MLYRQTCISGSLRFYLLRFCIGYLATATAVLPMSSASAAPDRARGAVISVECSMCHGVDGIAPSEEVPNIAGQHYAYLLRQLENYQNGQRAGTIMQEVLRGLSRQQLRDISAYFASIPISVERTHAGDRDDVSGK